MILTIEIPDLDAACLWLDHWKEKPVPQIIQELVAERAAAHRRQFPEEIPEGLRQFQDTAPKPRVPVGHWIACADHMPDDEITVLVWISHQNEVTTAHHDSGLLERRKDSGWIMAGTSRVLIGVTHWCADIHPPSDSGLATAPQDSDS